MSKLKGGGLEMVGFCAYLGQNALGTAVSLLSVGT